MVKKVDFEGKKSDVKHFRSKPANLIIMYKNMKGGFVKNTLFYIKIIS